FIAGATGYTGRAVVAAARRAGFTTWAHVRPDSPTLSAWRARFEALGANVDTTAWEPPAMRERLAALRPDAVFALLGTTRKRARQTQHRDTYERIDYGLTALLIDAARAAVPLPRFIYLSSLGTGPGARGAYYRARVHAEAHLRQSGLPYIIARPSLITGDREESRPGERVAAVVMGGALGGLARLGMTGPQDRWGAMTGTELASALVRACGEPDVNRVLEAAALRRLAAAAA
ncbi:MAG TPA: NAD(P)H-binding protein, partial [Myxococcota bacterium]|nr:NAD(P)H-binding protein [Myxococcota bacterium]